MNCNEFQADMADYVGNELSPERRAAAAAHLAACAACREAVGGLSAAAAVFESGLLSEAQAESAAAALQPTPALRLPARAASQPASAARWLHAGLRYAAVLVLAFGGGYWARGAREPVDQAPPAKAIVTEGVVDELNPKLVAGYAAASQDFPQASTFSRSLLALARR